MRTTLPRIASMLAIIACCLAPTLAAERAAPDLVFSCAADNDLYRVLAESDRAYPRFDTPAEAVAGAAQGAGVLILADGYPQKPTALSDELFRQAANKQLRLYVEYPALLPGMTLGAPTGPRQGEWGQMLERAVVTADVFGPTLGKMRILMVHDCHYLPVQAANPHLVLARVSGFDTARFGLPQSGVHPILFEHPRGDMLVSTTKLSQFVTARYAPTEAWNPVWQMILGWLQPGKAVPELKWTPTVRPVYGPDETLPADFELQTIRRGTEWFVKSGLLVHPSWQERYDRPSNMGPPTEDWPYGHRAGHRPDPSRAVGDGSLGMLEGFRSRIFSDGSQPVLWWRRHDCNAEIAGAMAMVGALLQDERFRQIGGNLGDWLYTKSLMTQGDRADPDKGDFGLTGWNDVPRYYGNMHGYNVYYADDNARGMLGMIKAASALKTDRWDERLAQCLLANMRITSRLGFSPERIDGPLATDYWRSRFDGQFTFFCPHHQAYLQACYLWAYRQTGDRLFLDRAKSAIRLTLEAYPDQWSWTNGQITLERARLIFPLAWLVRVEDTPEHRAWLDRMVQELLADQVECGAIRTRIVRSPASNEAYGTGETALVDQNGDPVSDLLYESNFALVGLREASAATGNAEYRKAEDKLAEYICRIQAKSEAHPELDGVWYRGFDYERSEYWAADADIGWSLWSTETGWTQAEILSTLVLRQWNTSLWEYTADSNISQPFDTWRKRMLPDDEIAVNAPPAETAADAGVTSSGIAEPTVQAGLVANDAGHDMNPGESEEPAHSEAATVSDRPYDEPYRPQFHFTFKRGWLSDINGPVYYQGTYHLFGQHNPAGPGLNYPNIHWGHAVSKDLIHWTERPPAIAPDETGPIFSGTAVVDGNNTSGFQTGEDAPIVLFYTAASYILPSNEAGSQCIAYSTDGGKTWRKYAGNPILEPITHYNRDPKVFWHAPTGKWIMAITLSCAGWLDGDYTFALFTSPDLKTWTETQRFEMPRGIDCPDMFELPVDGDPRNTRWVFWAGDGTHAIGTFDGKTFTRDGDIHSPLIDWPHDGANGYSAQTFANIPPCDGRCIQIAWMRHGRYPGMPFNQQATFPVELTLRSTEEGIRLFREPIREIELLHGKAWQWRDLVLSPGDDLLADVGGELFRVQAEITPHSAAKLTLRVRGNELRYDPEQKTLTYGGRSIPAVGPDGTIRLELLIDRTSLEIFADRGRTSMTFYLAPHADAAPLGIESLGQEARLSSLVVRELKSIWHAE